MKTKAKRKMPPRRGKEFDRNDLIIIIKTIITTFTTSEKRNYYK